MLLYFELTDYEANLNFFNISARRVWVRMGVRVQLAHEVGPHLLSRFGKIPWNFFDTKAVKFTLSYFTIEHNYVQYTQDQKC